MSKIAVLGSGPVGQVLVKGFSDAGHEARQTGRSGFTDAAGWADIVVLAIKGSAAEEVVGNLTAQLKGKVVIDTTNPIGDKPPTNGVLNYFTGPNDSLMERLQKKAPEARFVKAFNSVANHHMVKPKQAGGPPTMFICGNDDAAKKTVAGILEQLGWDVADFGKVEAARAIEPLCMLYCIPGIAGGMWSHAFKLLRS